MSEKESIHSVIVNIPGYRRFAKVSVCDLKVDRKKKVSDNLIRKPSDTLRTYTLPCSKALRINSLKNDTRLLSYRLYAKEQNIKQRAAIRIHERYKNLNTDLHNRLLVENPPDDVQAKTKIDENYFRYYSHPAPRYIPLYKSLKFQFHDRIRMKQEIGYKQDDIMNIEEHKRKELETYERSVRKHVDQVKQLDEFIAKDYQNSMATLKKCGELTAYLSAQILLRDNLANRQFTIQSRLIGLDYFYFVEQKYGRFLYYLSPPSWRVKHREFAHSIEIEVKGFDLGTTSEEDTFNVIFQNMEKECSNGLVKPVLYFSHPGDLMSMFESMEQQYLNHFTHVAYLSSRAMYLSKGVEKLKSSIQLDTASVAHLIEGFERLVDFCEEREAQLQAKFMKILSNLLYDTVAAPDVLKLKFNLEFYYEKLFREESFHKDCLSTAKALEDMYMEYLFKLDAFTNDSLTMAMKRCRQKEANKIRKAHVAARELRLFDRLEHALLRAFEKNSRNVESTTKISAKRVLSRQVKRQTVKPLVRVSSQQYSLTEAELEYLRLFTDWTINEDPAKYLHRLSTTDRIYSVNE